LCADDEVEDEIGETEETEIELQNSKRKLKTRDFVFKFDDGRVSVFCI
jgi:hypothetical protein